MSLWSEEEGGARGGGKIACDLCPIRLTAHKFVLIPTITHSRLCRGHGY